MGHSRECEIPDLASRGDKNEDEPRIPHAKDQRGPSNTSRRSSLRPRDDTIYLPLTIHTLRESREEGESSKIRGIRGAFPFSLILRLLGKEHRSYLNFLPS
jgi:hypothetical protein